MSVQVSKFARENTVKSVIYMLISFLFAIISIVLLIILLNLYNFNIDGGILFELGFLDVFSDLYNLNEVVYYAAPLVLTGLSVGIAFKAGLFNIGGQGQLIIGGVSSAIWAASIAPESYPFITKSKFLIISTTILVGFLGGAFWGFIPGVLKAKTGAHEVITTIMMNLIATSTLLYLIGHRSYSPFIDDSVGDVQVQSKKIVPNAEISKIFDNGPLDYTALIVLVLVIVVQFVLFRTRLGYYIRAVGLNKDAAETAGIKSDRITIITMSIAGGLAGLAGTFYILGTQHQYQQGFEGTTGFDGIAVSLIAQNSPFGIIFAALFFGYLRVAKNNIDFNSNFPGDLISVLQALLILFAAIPELSRRVYNQINSQLSEEDDDSQSKSQSGESEPVTEETMEELK